MKFVNIPNNPINASAVLVAKDCPKGVLDGLKKLNITPIFSGDTSFSISSVRHHPDVQITHIRGNKFVVLPELFDYYKKVLPGANIIEGSSNSQGDYPDDASYNVANTGKFIIHNFNYTDKTVLSNIEGEKINVSQGYSKCSICIVDENSVITEDAGIVKALEKHNIDVLKISAGDVKLKGMNYGFLGGASGKISFDKLVFAGDIKKHRDYKKIIDFCHRKKVKTISLSNDVLTDIGSILPIYEKD